MTDGTRTDIRNALRDLVGVRFPGGCDDCHAETHLSEVEPGVFLGNVGHDPTCPTFRRIKRRERR